MKSHSSFRLKFALSLLVLIVLVGSAYAQLDSCYHTRAKLDTFITNLVAADTSASGHHVIHVDTIGWSHSNGFLGVRYPIYCIKLSSHPNDFADQPTALLIGHIHGEEVLGMETMLDLIRNMAVIQYGRSDYRTLIQNTQMYFVPTMNPAGLEVVSRNWDPYYRKNDYHPPSIDTCIIHVGAGGDTCGVDLNRQADFNWIYGDTLLDPEGTEPYDYFRGPSPWSEPEAACIRDLSIQIKPAISAVFHLSRQGGNAERCIAAWDWQEFVNGPDKPSPDCTAIGYINNLYSYQYPLSEVTQQRYHVVFHTIRNGELQDWFYRELGTIQFNTELGPSRFIQPPCHGRDSLVALYVPAFAWLLNRNLNLDHATQSPVVIHTYSGPTNTTPISAEWRLTNTWSPILDPWYTNEQYGSATTLLAPSGSQSAVFMARKEGWADTTVVVAVPRSDPVHANLHLRPLPWHTLTLHLRDAGGNAIAGRVYLDAEFPHWVTVPTGGASISLPEGSFRAMSVSDAQGYMVLWRSFYLGGDATEEIYLPASSQNFSENFDAGLANWTAGGVGNTWNIDPDTTSMNFGNSLLTDTLGYRAQYDDNMNATLTNNNPITLGSGANNAAYMTMWRRGRLDFPGDSLFVEVQAGSDTLWAVAAGYSDLELPWTQSWIDLSHWCGQTIRLRFRFHTDAALGDLGLHIDNLAIYSGTDNAAPAKPEGVTYTYRIAGSYPNPFNPTTTISYEVAHPGLVRLVLFNTLGQEVRRFEVNAPSAGPQSLMWDGKSASGSPVGSGLYFVQLQAAGSVSTHKMLLLR